jgi:tyrosine-protein kinase Etk/Wzc
MTAAVRSESSGGEPQSRSGGSFIDVLTILLQWKRFIVINVLAVSIFVVGISLLMPKWYRATTSVLPPKQQDLFGAVSGAGSLLKSLAGMGKIGQKQGSYNYFAILKSRTINEEMVRRFHLIDEYDVPDSSMEKAVKELMGNVSFEEQTDEHMTIEVFDKDPVRAADMANTYVELLNSLSLTLSTQEARNNKEYVGRRLDTAWAELTRAEDRMRAYQEKSGMMISPEQAETIKPIATLYAMKVRKEIELAIALRGTTEENPAVRQLQLELSELNRKLAGVPEIGLQSIRLYRDMMIQQRIVEFLTPVHEQARIDEQRDVPVVVVLDKAIAPERKARPQRMLITLVAAFLTLFGSIVMVLVMHGLVRRREDPRQLAQRLRRLSLGVARRYRVPVPANVTA